MNAYHYQTKRDRSYFEWGNDMQITRKGKGDIAMTESELVDFFSVTWKKLNYRLQQLLKEPSLRPNERNAGEQEVFVNGRLQGYAPLYPLSIIIALSYQFGQHGSILLQEIHLPRVTTSCICDGADIPIWKWQYQLICFSLSPILSYYITTRRDNTVKEKGLALCSQKGEIAITTTNYSLQLLHRKARRCLFYISNNLYIFAI